MANDKTRTKRAPRQVMSNIIYSQAKLKYFLSYSIVSYDTYLLNFLVVIFMCLL